MATEDSTVTAKIYDVTGQPIRMIELGHVAAGNYVESNRAMMECWYLQALISTKLRLELIQKHGRW